VCRVRDTKITREATRHGVRSLGLAREEGYDASGKERRPENNPDEAKKVSQVQKDGGGLFRIC
jgi:hypothetical protein